MEIAPFRSDDRAPLQALLEATPEFTGDEAAVALELADEILGRGAQTSYRGLSAWAEDGRYLGWACFGQTPMTESTYDLYWIVVSPDARGLGVGRHLHQALLDEVRRLGGQRIRIETSTREGYGATLAFYDRLGYARVGLIRDFYAPGDDLVTGVIELGAPDEPRRA